LDLGPLSVETAGVVRPLTGRRLSALLAALLVRSGQFVTPDYLIDAVWGDDVTDRAPAALDTLVWRLRRQLEPTRAPGSPWTVLTHTETHGYRLDVADGDVDSRAFGALAARMSRGDLSASERLDGATAALRLWRGLPYEGVPDSDRIDAIRAQLTGQRLIARGPSDDEVFAVARLLPYWVDRLIAADPLRISAALDGAVSAANDPLAWAAARLVRGAVLAANQQAADAHDQISGALSGITRMEFGAADPSRWIQIADLLMVVASCCWIGDDFELATTVASVAAGYADRLRDADLRLCTDTFHGLTLLGTDPGAAASTSTALSAQCEAVGNDLAALMASVTCSIAALRAGDGAAGLHWTSVALRLQRTLGVRSIADTLETRGNHYVAAGQEVEAVRCYAAAHAQQHRLGRPWPHHEVTDQRLAVTRTRLAQAEFAAAWADGERIAAADLVDDWL